VTICVSNKVSGKQHGWNEIPGSDQRKDRKETPHAILNQVESQVPPQRWDRENRRRCRHQDQPIMSPMQAHSSSPLCVLAQPNVPVLGTQCRARFYRPSPSSLTLPLLVPIPILELPEKPKELREKLSNENELRRHDDPLCSGYREGNNIGDDARKSS
jgi:hypothetical protein